VVLGLAADLAGERGAIVDSGRGIAFRNPAAMDYRLAPDSPGFRAVTELPLLRRGTLP